MSDFSLKLLADKFAKHLDQFCETELDIVFTKDPQAEEKNIIEYEGKMRVDGMTKFNGPCYISALNVYQSEKDLRQQKTCGVIAMFIKEEFAATLFKARIRELEGQETVKGLSPEKLDILYFRLS